MKVLLILIALLIPTTGVLAKKPKPMAIKRYTCPTSYTTNNTDLEQDRRVRYNPEFLRFRVQGKDVADIVDMIATYDVRESDLPEGSVLNPGGKCDYGKEKKGKRKITTSKAGR